tara:strand:+ start:171 stop:986 length:816 start_codon:yes stop_codon:yes gene_type:complete
MEIQMRNVILMLFAVLLFVCVCDVDLKKIMGGNEAADTDSSVPSSNTDLGLLQSDDTDTQVPSQNANDADLNNMLAALDSAANSAADSGLDNLFSSVDEQQGVAQAQTVPDPINYPQQAAESQPASAQAEVAAPQVEPAVQVPAEPETPAVEAAPNNNVVSGYDSTDNQFQLDQQNVADGVNKLKPNELLPKDAVDMTNKDFLTATITDTATRTGEATKGRNRKNYDLRSTPVIEKKNISPWNLSTIEPDTTRRQFEIGASDCPPCPGVEA